MLHQSLSLNAQLGGWDLLSLAILLLSSASFSPKSPDLPENAASHPLWLSRSVKQSPKSPFLPSGAGSTREHKNLHSGGGGSSHFKSRGSSRIKADLPAGCRGLPAPLFVWIREFWTYTLGQGPRTGKCLQREREGWSCHPREPLPSSMPAARTGTPSPAPTSF